MNIRVADFIIEFLQSKQVDNVFLLSGGGMMHLLDAVRASSNVQYICHHHEQASAMAADAYARVSGNLGVCYATSGPGATNLLTGIVGAYQDSSPVLYITGQSKLCQTIRGTKSFGLRQFGTFEVDVVPIFESVTKYCVQIDDPESIKYHLEKAYHLAMEGRPGPVLLDIPVDIQGATINPDSLIGYSFETSKAHKADEIKVGEISNQLLNAKRPLILVGHGVRVARATKLFGEAIEKLNIPVVTTQLGKDVLPYDNALFVGHPGMKGDRAANFAVQNADYILCLGCSLHVLTTGYELDLFASNAYIAFVDIDKHVLEREQINVDIKIQADVHSFLEQMSSILKGIKPTVKSHWLEQCMLWKKELSVFSEIHQVSDEKINFYDVIKALNKFSSGTEIITTDAGSAFYVVGQALRIKNQQRVICSGSLGAMGFALPAAVGASIAEPNKQVLCITGDGSLQTNLHDLATISHNKLNVIVFVINNNGYVSIKNTQVNFFEGNCAGVDSHSGVSTPNLKLISQAYNLPYYSIVNQNELDEQLKCVLSSDGPLVCEIFSTQDQVVIPTVSSKKLDDGSMVSKPLDDMFPFMSDEERKKYLDFE